MTEHDVAVLIAFQRTDHDFQWLSSARVDGIARNLALECLERVAELGSMCIFLIKLRRQGVD